MTISYDIVLAAMRKHLSYPSKTRETNMWADAQRDGGPAEYKWRPLQKFCNSIPCITPQTLAGATARVPRSNAANMGERKTWIQ